MLRMLPGDPAQVLAGQMATPEEIEKVDYAAVREGRVVYGNIRAFVRYLFSCNLSEMLVVGLDDGDSLERRA